MSTWHEVRNFASQKFRLTLESKFFEKLDPDPFHFSISAVAGVWWSFLKWKYG